MTENIAKSFAGEEAGERYFFDSHCR